MLRHIKIQCDCKKEACPRHGKCAQCLAHHKQHRRHPPYCKRKGRKIKPIFETPRLLLRELDETDYENLCGILQDKDVMYAYEHAFSEQEVRRWLATQIDRYKKDGVGLWGVIEKETGAFIGQAGLVLQELPDGQAPEVSYLFKKEYWHRGYATEAAKGCMEYAFAILGLSYVCSTIRDNNLPSQKVALRNGMVQTGSFMKHYYGMDMPHLIFSANKDDNFFDIGLAK